MAKSEGERSRRSSRRRPSELSGTAARPWGRRCLSALGLTYPQHCLLSGYERV